MIVRHNFVGHVDAGNVLSRCSDAFMRLCSRIPLDEVPYALDSERLR